MPRQIRTAECHPERKHFGKNKCKNCYDKEYAKNNRARINATSRKWAKNNHKKVLAISRKYLYGIDDIHVRALLRAQDGVCKICMKEPASHLDHDHKNGMPRSLLCGPCNQGLGFFKENVQSLQNAVKYLELWKDWYE